MRDLIKQRAALISKLLQTLEGKVQASQRFLLQTVIEDFVDGLEKDEAGNIKNTMANKRKFATFDNVFNRFANEKGLESVQAITQGVTQIIDFNKKYFEAFVKPAKLAPIQDQVKETLGAWLGISPNGKVAPNGYLDTLIKSDTVRNGIKNMVLKSVVSQGGYNDLKKTLKSHIEGDQEQTGALEKYYRNFAYDTYSVVDRTAGKITADKLAFNYAIYEGGIIETSREFCIEKNGKVFSRDEIGDMMPDKAIPPNYDPFTDMGGYGCRHHWNWVPDAVAFALRPELRSKAVAPPKPIAPPPKPKAEPAPANKMQPAKTVKEARKTAANILTENHGFNIKAITIDTGLSIDLLNGYLSQLNDLSKEYQITPVAVGKAPIAIKFKSTKTYGGVVKSLRSSGEIVEINLGSTKTAGHRTFDENRTGLPSFSRADKENQHLSTLTHEFAHVIGISNQQNNPRLPAHLRQFWTELKDLETGYRKELRVIMEKATQTGVKKELNRFYLGAYASTNLNEFMAEAFTEYKLSSIPSPYAIKVGKLIDKYFKKAAK